MDGGTADDERGLDRGFGQVSPLSRAERVTLLTLTAGLLLAGAVMHVVAGDPLPAVVYESSFTVTLAGFAFAPRLSALVCVILLFGAFFSDAQALALVVGAVAFALVVRTCGLGIVVLFAVLWSSGLVWSAIENGTPIGETVVLIVVGVVSASSGLVLRRLEAGSRRLKEQLEVRARAEHESIVSERLRIADELHDVVAHDLTIIAMHVNLLGECEAHDASLEAIRSSSRRALDDLRRVVGESHLRAADGAATCRSELQEAVADGCRTMERAGMRVRTALGEIGDLPLPRIVDLTLSRLVREATTNVLKHSSGTDIVVRLRTTPGLIAFEISNPVDTVRRAPRVPSGGFGLVRMRERVSRIGGTLVSGSAAGIWTLSVSVPVDCRGE
ncbi:sensor histidine kinase [Microbacterium sp. LWO12-1.2]|uniref:sensor histidine kinase n=1 Tax=Microbacterium sp. LWO12-1.2 TaxID=3135261 RepID=UPI003441D56E